MLYSEKIESVQDLGEKFSSAPLAILADYRGLTVAEITDVRRKLRSVDGELLVTKNTLTKLAIKDTDTAVLTDHLAGPTAVAFGYGDAVAVAKVVDEAAKEYEAFELKAGVLDGELLESKQIEQLAKMPGRDELRAQLLALLMTPATQMVRVLSAPAQNLAQVLAARKNDLDEG